MNEKRNANHPPVVGLALNDIYYVLFRHKWKILIFSILGLATAAGIYFYRGTTYQSEADVWIKYVESTKPVSPTPSAVDTIVPYHDGDDIINTEITIINSFDLAKQVATNVGPEKVLAKLGGGSDVVAAATAIHDNLLIQRVPHSPVLRVIFSHPDKDLVQRVLEEIVVDYQSRHAELNSSANSSYDTLQSETSTLKSELDAAEDNLRREKAKANISDLDEARKSTSQKMSSIRYDLMAAVSQLTQRQNNLKKLQDSTNHVAASSVTSSNTLPELTDDQIDEYNDAREAYNLIKKSYDNMRVELPEHNSLVQEKFAQLKIALKKKQDLEKADPRLRHLKIASNTDGTRSTVKTTDDRITDEQDAIDDLQEKIKILQADMVELHAESTNLDAAAPAIQELERQVHYREEYYRNYLNSLEQAKIENDVTAGKNANIQVTQKPTPPSLERSKTPKMMGIAAVMGILAGLVWAFFVELYLDHSVRRPKEIEGSLGMRLFLSIPDVYSNGSRFLGTGAKKRNGKPAALLPETVNGNGSTAANGAAPAASGVAVNGAGAKGNRLEVAPWDRNHSLHNYYEALRDRLISYFEVNNLNHKPKLVAVTGSEQGAGTTTIAAGLAASLSETGDGNVLLIDMNLEHGATQEFYNGKPNCELDAALANETRDSAMVQNNLYVVSGKSNGDQLSRMLPKRFANLLPKLKASDYDYIIFDMPPIARTGVTQRLAGFMDMMLLVVEAEKTSRDVVKQAGGLLTESKANVSVVLNKTRTYIPKRFHQEF
ncbi:MAG TPA: AAA family ATPase [Verrucomicrobiae bacterium]|jgi:uncharacterized protein involved in exopolysaccharide biosynthesis/Mrp family chromosome partitioning ATPase|nr:AAA family ATPase [Verrucomicrobiae bacterium]